MSTRPIAKWKVAYQTELVAMHGEALLEETLRAHAAAEDSEWGGLARDRAEARISRAELTRRLTEVGFLPPAQPPIGA